MNTKNIIAKMDKHYSLTYCDYRDTLDENAELIERIVNSKDGMNILYEESIDWNLWEQEGESIDYILKELLTEEELEDLTDEDRQELIDEIYNRRDDDYVKDILNNTSTRYFYYDLNEYINDESEIKVFAKKFNLDYENVLSIYRECFGCGQACIFFWAKTRDLLNNGNTITFDDDCELAFIDRVNGSGFSGKLGKKLSLSFNRENLHDDEGNAGYSFTGDVCGLVGNAMGEAYIHDTKRKLKEISTNEIAKEQKVTEEMYEKNWKAGKCSFGDMNIKRHKDTPYSNDYPCGNKCTACGTFWID